MAIIQPPPLINLPRRRDGYTAVTTHSVFPGSTLRPSSDAAERLDAAARGLVREKSRFRAINWNKMDAYSALLMNMSSREELLKGTWNDVVDNVRNLKYLS